MIYITCPKRNKIFLLLMLIVQNVFGQSEKYNIYSSYTLVCDYSLILVNSQDDGWSDNSIYLYSAPFHTEFGTFKQKDDTLYLYPKYGLLKDSVISSDNDDNQSLIERKYFIQKNTLVLERTDIVLKYGFRYEPENIPLQRCFVKLEKREKEIKVLRRLSYP